MLALRKIEQEFPSTDFSWVKIRGTHRQIKQRGNRDEGNEVDEVLFGFENNRG